jgi:hypothetical protein
VVIGRKSSVGYFAGEGAYFTNFDGQRYRLADGPDDAPRGPTNLTALRKFGQLKSVETAVGSSSCRTI